MLIFCKVYITKMKMYFKEEYHPISSSDGYIIFCFDKYFNLSKSDF